MSLRTSSSRCHSLLNAASVSTKSTSASQATQVRHAHNVPSLGRHDATFKAEGVKGVFSPGAFKVAWTDYQGHMVDRLNRILAGDARENWDTKTLLLQTARDPATANTFNYASMAHNNHFFFSTLSPTTTPMPAELSKALQASFSSLPTFKSTLLSTALGMFGPGFVWLVQDHSPSSTTSRAPTVGSALPTFRILTTYLAGSPYPGAHARQQSRDLSTQNLASAEDHRRQTSVQNSVGSFGRRTVGMEALDGGNAGGDVRRFGGADVTPVLCVNTWEHAWVGDFGVAGKRRYLEGWWERVDWDEVWARCVVQEERGLGARGGFYRS